MHSPIVLAIAHVVLTGVSVFIVAKLLPGMKVKSITSAIFFAFVVGILNAIAWHFLAPLTYTFAVLTLGFGALVINGLLFLLAGRIVEGIEISGCVTAALGSIGVTFVNWAMHLVLGKWAP